MFADVGVGVGIGVAISKLASPCLRTLDLGVYRSIVNCRCAGNVSRTDNM